MVVVFDIETLGLDAFQHQIVLIGMKVEGKIKQCMLWEEKDELAIISKCLKIFERIPLFETIVGYNNLKFDVPFLATRLSVMESGLQIYGNCFTKTENGSIFISS